MRERKRAGKNKQRTTGKRGVEKERENTKRGIAPRFGLWIFCCVMYPT
jgi:hypothetical protein